MRLVSYNILDGGEGRADPLAEVILAGRPDVVALVEADVPAVVERLARRLDMDYVVGRGRGRHASALLSRWPIRQSINHAAVVTGLSNSFLEATVVSPDTGAEWPVGVVHLPAGAYDADEDRRTAELAVVLDRLNVHRADHRPHLLCGDFNANADYQPIDPAECKPATRQAYAANGGRLPTLAVAAIVGCGYLDAYHARHGEQQPIRGSFTTQHPGQRVDYVFAWGVPARHVRDAWVEHDRLAKYASDHFPLGVEIAETG